ncbi:transcription antitermination factor NusB [Rickettsiales endosymbiont of Stachyamoeba lipophora]|uniref:transcription antitermination factor NusB n=1 Tax=Rickettsiales endosymbiont of Stachyamoeba lipophora TaxID=2486578 RepID=UPI0013DDB3B0|nr:transcription antitermination factor NusB [Rickettsiales endosymbiont of Stachyamoeba lipophora]
MTDNIQQITPEEQKKLTQAKKAAARLAAIQFCYSLLLINKESDPENILTLNKMFSESIVEKPDKKHYYNLTKAIKFHTTEAKIELAPFLANGKSFEQLDKLYQAILLTAACEAKEFKGSVPPKVIINEYTNVAASFADPSLTKFINAVIDKFVKNLNLL